MTIYLIDSALSNSGGHHDHFVRGWRDSSMFVKSNTVVLGPKNATTELRREFELVPVFSLSLYEQASPRGGPVEDFRVGSATFAHDLAKSGVRPAKRDVIFLPTATPRELAGICRWARESGQPGSAVAAVFHWGTAEAIEAHSQYAEHYRITAAALGALRARRCWIGATHGSLKRGLEAVFQQRVHLVPSVSFFPQPGGSMARHPGCPSVAFLGGARPAKGVALLPCFLQSIADEQLPLRVVVQCHGIKSHMAGLDRFRSETVNVIDDWLPPERFAALLMGVTAVALPYDRRTYGAMVSGVFTIAAAMGKPCIVPSNTWMSERILLGEAAGVVYEGDGSGALLAGVKQFLANVEPLAAAAVQLMHPWRRAYSAEPLLEAILRLHEEP